MIGKLAKQTIEKWLMEGLQPKYEDIILLNGLAVKLENNSEAYNFSAVPRVAFLGDYCIWEPTVHKKIWMDCAVQLIANNYLTHLVFTVFALNCPDTELPSLKDSKAINESLEKCRTEIVEHFSDTQIVAAIKYVMKGNDPDEDAEWNIEKKKDEFDSYNIPKGLQSQAKQILMEALSYGLDGKLKYEVTVPELERMVTVAAIHNGSADVLKNENAQRVGAFYAAAGTIHERLKEEKAKKDLKVK